MALIGDSIHSVFSFLFCFFFFSPLDSIIGLSLRISIPDRKHFSTYPVPWTRHPVLLFIASW